MSREVREIARKIKDIDPKHPFRTESSAQLLEKLYAMGLISTRWDLSLADGVTATSFCRRRLPVVMFRSKFLQYVHSLFIFYKFMISSTDKMAESIKHATKLIQQGHVRVGPELIKDPAFLVTRSLEDFVTWVDNSAIRKHVLEYNNTVSFISRFIDSSVRYVNNFCLIFSVMISI